MSYILILPLKDSDLTERSFYGSPVLSPTKEKERLFSEKSTVDTDAPPFFHTLATKRMILFHPNHRAKNETYKMPCCWRKSILYHPSNFIIGMLYFKSANDRVLCIFQFHIQVTYPREKIFNSTYRFITQGKIKLFGRSQNCNSPENQTTVNPIAST